MYTAPKLCNRQFASGAPRRASAHCEQTNLKANDAGIPSNGRFLKDRSLTRSAAPFAFQSKEPFVAHLDQKGQSKETLRKKHQQQLDIFNFYVTALDDTYRSTTRWNQRRTVSPWE